SARPDFCTTSTYHSEKLSFLLTVIPVSDIDFLSFCFTLAQYNHNAENQMAKHHNKYISEFSLKF
ncbi:MAG: hypothetical protein KGD70_15160, partial [Candidatus Lokiarchaeota archaeon]|nr:hypothetical protein [Candidatus Lokiarchaeota archaeon]